MTELDGHAREFHHDGFTVVRQFLEQNELAQLVGELDRYVRDVVPTLAEGDAFYQDSSRPETLKQLQRMSGDPFFAEYQHHERWRALADALVGEPCEPQQPEWFNKPSGVDHATPPHQDNYYFCLRPCHVATLWLALDPIDETNGCLRYVAGSHREPIRPHGATSVLGFSQGISDYGQADSEREVPVCLQPGDLVAHHGATIHRAEANRSSRQRRAFAIVFHGCSVQRDEQAYSRYLAALDRQHQQLQ